MAMSSTIKVSTDLRDRLNARARNQGVTVAQSIERLLAHSERAEFFAVMRAQYAAMSPDDRAEYEAEVRLWDAAAGDGLEGSW